MWEKDSSPRIALDILQCPKAHGRLDLLNLDTRNEAIEITCWNRRFLLIRFRRINRSVEAPKDFCDH